MIQIPKHEGDSMHAVVVNLTILDPERDLQALRDNMVRLISHFSGFVTGYWTRSDDSGLSFLVFDSEATANEAAWQLRSAWTDEVARLETVEVREVVAHA